MHPRSPPGSTGEPHFAAELAASRRRLSEIAANRARVHALPQEAPKAPFLVWFHDAHPTISTRDAGYLLHWRLDVPCSESELLQASASLQYSGSATDPDQNRIEDTRAVIRILESLRCPPIDTSSRD